MALHVAAVPLLVFRFVHVSNNTQDKAASVFSTGSVMSREVQCLQHKHNYVTVLHPQDLIACVSQEGWEADVCRDQRSCEHIGSEISTDTPMKMGPRSGWPGFLKTSFSFSLKVGMWSSLFGYAKLLSKLDTICQSRLFYDYNSS